MTAVPARFYRNEAGAGECLISSGFPVPPGLVPASLVTDRKIKVLVGGVEQPCNISMLRGTHNDGTIRSVLIQFRYIMEQGDSVAATVVFDEGARTTEDIEYTRPYWEMVFDNNNVILPEGADYLCSTMVSLRYVLPPNEETPSETKLYTSLAEDRFEALSPCTAVSDASYDQIAARIALWCKLGSGVKYQRDALRELELWLPSMTPSADKTIDLPCLADSVANPDGRENASICGIGTEWHSTRMFSLATMYLLTGYRDLWGIVAYIQQRNVNMIETRDAALEKICSPTEYGRNRWNSFNRYRALIPAFMIDATIPVEANYNDARVLNWAEQLEWTVDGILHSAWNIRWVPFSDGSGTVPADYTLITQASGEGVLHGVYTARNIPRLLVGDDMPSDGWLMLADVSGLFSSGALSGISATASGPDEDDYRNGMVGVKSICPLGPRSGSTEIELQIYQMAFPLGFLIDYYLYVKKDERIPQVVKTSVDVILKNIRAITPDDVGFYGKGGSTWGTVGWLSPYTLENPIDDVESPWTQPMYARAVAFVIKTLGDTVVNGRLLSDWYESLIDTANVSPGPQTVLTWSWKIYGQTFGMTYDTSWIMAQESVLDAGPSTAKTPIQYTSIPDEGIDPIIPDPPDGPDEPSEPEPSTGRGALAAGGRLIRIGNAILRI